MRNLMYGKFLHSHLVEVSIVVALRLVYAPPVDIESQPNIFSQLLFSFKNSILVLNLSKFRDFCIHIVGVTTFMLCTKQRNTLFLILSK